MIRLERNVARMVRWMGSVRPEERVSSEKLKTSLNFKSLR